MSNAGALLRLSECVAGISCRDAKGNDCGQLFVGFKCAPANG
jgi:hypothetical protein